MAIFNEPEKSEFPKKNLEYPVPECKGGIGVSILEDLVVRSLIRQQGLLVGQVLVHTSQLVLDLPGLFVHAVEFIIEHIEFI
jgi:hypothetical protein